jgi:hypothetical protein
MWSMSNTCSPQEVAFWFIYIKNCPYIEKILLNEKTKSKRVERIV